MGSFFGEYGQNKKRQPIPIYKSADKGKSWNIVYNIEAKKARHTYMDVFGIILKIKFGF